MKVIGITGGIGAGKTTVLNIIRETCSCYILLADEAAHEVKKKGHVCYDELVSLLGSGILGADGEIDKPMMADIIFKKGNEELLEQVNDIIHPRVREYILEKIEEYRKLRSVDYFFIEAALLIEDGYREICDELWYIYAPRDVRAGRLKESRNYTDDKIRNIMDKQKDDSFFRANCDRVIDNPGSLLETRRQIEAILSGESDYGRG
ncbi:MAG: dephospho-CoA kinase [Lachnospiraceae bacterium]|nr:dephospho-CoA kinase [Lachnospiraceae bacterium]